MSRREFLKGGLASAVSSVIPGRRLSAAEPCPQTPASDRENAQENLIRHHGDYVKEIWRRHPEPMSDAERERLKTEMAFARTNNQFVVRNENGIDKPYPPNFTPKKGGYRMPEPSERLLDELATPYTIEDPVTGQAFRTLFLNREKASDPNEEVLLSLPGWNNTATGTWYNHHTELKAKRIALLTGKPLIMINHPQIGLGSESLTIAQMKALYSEEDYKDIGRKRTPREQLEYAASQGYGEIARAQLRALENAGIEGPATLFGGSMGAWAVAKVAEIAALREQAGVSQNPIHIKKLILAEYPGIENFTFMEFLKRMKSESRLLKLYKAAHYDYEFREATMQTQTPDVQRSAKYQEIRDAYLNDPTFLYPNAMARDTLPQTLRSAMSANQALVLVSITGTQSLICPREASKRMLAELRRDFPERVYSQVYPGETHLYAENPWRYAEDIARNVKG